ncbi:MAG: metal ABC transporter solute-binding protein, Zn/Mn family [Candidatus Electrothrix sp. YB6]
MKIHTVMTLLLSALFTAAGAHAAPMQVFVSIAPQKWLVDRVGGELVDTHILLDKGQDPHLYQPTPEKLTALFRSRLYLIAGMPFEQEIARKIASDTGVRIIDVTEGIRKVPMIEHDGHNDPDKNEHDQHEEHQHEDPEDQHDHLDPHVWLAPLNLRQMAKNTAAALADADPENGAVYRQNLQTVTEQLTRLHKEISKQLAPFRGAAFFVFHPAFGYFAHAYGLHQEAVETEGKAPSAKQLYALVRQARKKKVKVLFVQPQFDRKNAHTVAQAIHGTLVELDPLAEDVEQNLRLMADRISAALTPQ